MIDMAKLRELSKNDPELSKIEFSIPKIREENGKILVPLKIVPQNVIYERVGNNQLVIRIGGKQ